MKCHKGKGLHTTLQIVVKLQLVPTLLGANWDNNLFLIVVKTRKYCLLQKVLQVPQPTAHHRCQKFLGVHKMEFLTWTLNKSNCILKTRFSILTKDNIKKVSWPPVWVISIGTTPYQTQEPTEDYTSSQEHHLYPLLIHSTTGTASTRSPALWMTHPTPLMDSSPSWHLVEGIGTSMPRLPDSATVYSIGWSDYSTQCCPNMNSKPFHHCTPTH